MRFVRDTVLIALVVVTVCGILSGLNFIFNLNPNFSAGVIFTCFFWALIAGARHYNNKGRN